MNIVPCRLLENREVLRTYGYVCLKDSEYIGTKDIIFKDARQYVPVICSQVFLFNPLSRVGYIF